MTSSGDPHGARAVITGGTRGIGLAVGERLARPGARLVVAYLHDEQAAAAAVAALRDRGASAEAVRADCGSMAGTRELASAAADVLGGVDALVHCAVHPVAMTALEAEPDAFREAVERNGMSLLWLAQAFRHLLAPGAGVVYLTSLGSSRAVPGYVGVGAGKALGEALVRYLAAELAPSAVRVNAVCAGPVDTPAMRAVVREPERLLAAARRSSPSGRDLSPADVASAVALLLSPDSAMVQGHVLHVDGGLQLVR